MSRCLADRVRIVVEAAWGDRRFGRVIAQLLVAVLPEQAAELCVEIDRTAFYFIEFWTGLYSFVQTSDDEPGPHEMRHANVLADIAERVDIAVDAGADTIAWVGRAEDRQNKVGA